MNRYRQARVAKPMTQEELALAAGVSVRTVRRIENGELVGAESRRAIAAVLGMFEASAPRKTATSGIEIKGEANVSDPLDQQGILVIDMIWWMAMWGILFLTFAAVVQALSPESGQGLRPFPEWMLAYGPLPIGVLLLPLAGFCLWKVDRRMTRIAQIDIELTKTGEVPIADAVAEAVEPLETGRYALKMDGADAGAASFTIGLLARRPETLGDLVKRLSDCGVVAKRVPRKQTLFTIGNDFGSDYL